jgi:predicted phosphodiesterase
VEYAPKADYEATSELSASSSFAPEGPQQEGTAHLLLEGLLPATEYVYRIIVHPPDGDDLASPLGAFHTAPAPVQPVHLAVLADSQWQWEGVNRLEMVGDAIAADATPFDLILHAGDLVESPAAPYWDHWFASFDGMLRRAAFLPVLGNHERNHRSYYDAFDLPPGDGKADEQWWALHWGDVVVVGLDSNVTRADQYLDQQAWAREHLSGPEPHKLVMFHHPVFSSDAYHGGGYSYDVIFHPLFVEMGVDLVLNGHAHNYERIERDGITYLVLGGGGATPRPLSETRVEGSVVAVEGHHFYARVRCAGEGIGIEIVSVAKETAGEVTATSGDLLDAVVLSDDAGSAGPSLAWLLGATIAGLAVLLLLLKSIGD